MTIKTNLPSTVTVESRGIVREVDVAALAADLLPRVFEYGLRQKLADAAASALAVAFDEAHPDHDLKGDDLKARRKAWGDSNPEAVNDVAERLIDKAIARLAAGEWAERGAAATGDPLDPYRIQAVRDAIKASPRSDAAKAYAAIDASDQSARRAFLLDLAHENPDSVDPVARELKRIADDRVAATSDLSF